MDTQKIGKFIAECRKKQNLKQKDLANILHVTDKAISRWETGKGMPDSSLLIPLSNALHVSVTELLNGEYLKEEEFISKNEEMLVHTLGLTNKEKKEIKFAIIFTLALILLFLIISKTLIPISFFIIILLVMAFLIYTIVTKFKIATFLIIIILFIFFCYSFYTYDGAVRLSLFLMGYPKEAYTTKLTLKEKTEEYFYYYPESNIQVESGRMGLIRCKETNSFKFCEYYGYG